MRLAAETRCGSESRRLTLSCLGESDGVSGERVSWIDPNVELAANFSLKPKQVTEAQSLIEEHLDEIRSASNRCSDKADSP